MATRSPPSPDQSAKPDPGSLAELLAVLDVEQLDANLFRGWSTAGGWGRVYGGQVLAQAMVAASRTVDPARGLHSMHGYFLVGGTPAKPIVYEVQRLRDGGSFSTRRVTALQDGEPMFVMVGSFHASEDGFEHASAMPDVPPPEDLESVADLFGRSDAKVPDNMRAYYALPRPIELRIVDPQRYFGTRAADATGSAVSTKPATQQFWIKPQGTLPEEQLMHTAILAYASDFAMIDTALIPHGRIMFESGLQLASLDHALWIHRPFRADDWLLYALESPTAGRGRGFARGSFYTRSGDLVASVAQEGLMRERRTAFVIK